MRQMFLHINLVYRVYQGGASIRFLKLDGGLNLWKFVLFCLQNDLEFLLLSTCWVW